MNHPGRMQAARAQDLRDQRSSNSLNGAGAITGGVGSILTGAGKLANLDDDKDNVESGFGLAGSFLGTGGAGMGLAGKGLSETKATNSHIQQEKNDIVDEFLDIHKEKIQKDAAELAKQDFTDGNPLQELELQDYEAKQIAVMRLGLNKPKNTGDNIEVDYDAIFDKITEKRAKNIMNSNDADKKEMLAALGLTEKATSSEVAAVLRNE